MFRELLKHTPEDHPDFDGVESVLNKFNAINQEINDFKRVQDELIRTRHVEASLEGAAKLPPSDDRVFLRSVDCPGVWVGGKDFGAMHLLLFTDVMYVCKVSSSRDREIHKIKHAARLEPEMQVHDASVRRFPFAFEFHVPGGRKANRVVLAWNSLELKLLWMLEIEQQAKNED